MQLDEVVRRWLALGALGDYATTEAIYYGCLLGAEGEPFKGTRESPCVLLGAVCVGYGVHAKHLP